MSVNDDGPGVSNSEESSDTRSEMAAMAADDNGPGVLNSD